MFELRDGVRTVLPCLMPTSTAAAETASEVPACGITSRSCITSAGEK